MPHFFISYAREDKILAEAIANVLTSEGFDVWWDPEIQVGEQFPDRIEHAIFRSDYVLVLWSKSSVESEWVRREARTGQKLSRLFPIRLDDCELPRGFRSIHTHCFKGYPELLQELYRTVGGGGFTLPSGARHSMVASLPSASAWPAELIPIGSEDPFYKRHRFIIALAIVVSIACAALIYWIHSSRHPAPEPCVLPPPPYGPSPPPEQTKGTSQ